jgi:hypothetical protein
MDYGDAQKYIDKTGGKNGAELYLDVSQLTSVKL